MLQMERNTRDEFKEKLTEVFKERLTGLFKKSGKEDLTEFTEGSNIPYPTWQSWMSGSKLPGSAHLVKLAGRLNVSTDYLLGRDTEKTPDLQALYLGLGLTEDAVESLQRFKKDDRVAGLPLIPGRVKCKALSKALASPQVLEALASIMMLEQGEPGYYEGVTHDHFDPKDPKSEADIEAASKLNRKSFYHAELSPDSMAALLYLRLQLTLQQLRTGEAPAEYAPAKRRDEAECQRMVETGETDRLKRLTANLGRLSDKFDKDKADLLKAIKEEKESREEEARWHTY